MVNYLLFYYKNISIIMYFICLKVYTDYLIIIIMIIIYLKMQYHFSGNNPNTMRRETVVSFFVK